MTIATKRQPAMELPERKVEGIEAQFQAGYLILDNPNPMAGQFNIALEEALIAKGTHFFCMGHLCAVPITEQSPDAPDYCRGCLAGISAGKTLSKDKPTDYWTDNDSIFVHNGKRYGVSKSGATILVKDTTKPLEGDVSSESIRQKDVTKLGSGNILPPAPKTALKQREVMLHPGGRPTKQGKVSRMTEWRRKKRQ